MIRDNITAVVLAGGKGVRMESDLPKVLHKINSRPLIMYVLESLKKAGIERIITVVGYKGEMVSDAISGLSDSVIQKEQLGTGHAVMQAEKLLAGFDGNVVVACGDVPLIRPETFIKLIQEIKDEKVKAAVLTMKLENPAGYGRILKDSNGNFLRIVEEKDSDSEQKKIQEVNTGTYVFDCRFLFDGLKQIDTNNAQSEYYLPDALNYIIKSNFIVKTLLLENPVEGSGINNKSELSVLENLVNSGY
jgi:bifunctional UDP-N-acetylglucosamine pyrophosphorylase/glucosamine-1-phosphate N-acetyltransferase